MEALLWLLVLIGGSAAGAGWVHEREIARRRDATWQTVELRFGRETAEEAVLGLLGRISGLHGRAAVVLDVHAQTGRVRHYLSCDQATLQTLKGAVRALLPGLRLEPAEAPTFNDLPFARSIRVGGRHGTLRSEAAELTSASLLAALQPLGDSEQVLLRWVLRSGRARAVPRTDAKGEALALEERRVLRVKHEGGVLRVRGFVAATGPSGRARHLFARIASILRSQNTAYGFIRTRAVAPWWREHLLRTRSFLIADAWSLRELAPVLGWPVGSPALPGVLLGTSPQRMPSSRLPRTGRTYGDSTWPGEVRPVAQPVVGALSHSLITGPTGTGKSTLLTNLLAADAAHGRGLVLIDGKGDTVAALLERIPQGREQDVVVLDCASEGPLPGLMQFGSTGSELAADVVLGVLSDLFRDSWGPLSERYLRAGLLAVAADPRGTLADVPYVFTDAAYRRKLIGRIGDPLTRATFAAFESMSAPERQQQLAAPLNKLGQLLGRPTVRTVLGQADGQMDFGRVIRERRIVLVSLAPVRIGAAASRLIGALVVFALFQAVQARSRVPLSRRAPFFVAVDEPKALGDLPMPLDVLLEQARGLGVGVTLSPQSVTQLPKAVREAALTNVATRVVFAQNADDARLLARDLRGVSPEDLQDLGAFEAVARIGLGPGDVAAPVTIKTKPPLAATSDPSAVRARSEATYGQTLAAVDAAMDAKHAAPTSAAVGRKRRTP